MMVQVDTLDSIQLLLPSDHTLLWCWEYLDSPCKGWGESRNFNQKRWDHNRIGWVTDWHTIQLTTPLSKLEYLYSTQTRHGVSTVSVEPWQSDWLRHWRSLARRLGWLFTTSGVPSTCEPGYTHDNRSTSYAGCRCTGLTAHAHHDTASCGLTFDWVSVVWRHQGRQLFTYFFISCSSTFLAVHPTVSSVWLSILYVVSYK